MSKAGDTKGRILEMLKHKSMTMTDISRRMGLAPSTITQHLQEMEDAGAIRLVRSRKLKYYEVNEYPPMEVKRQAFGIKRIATPLAVIALLVIVVLALRIGSNNSRYANAQQVYVAPGSAVPPGSTVFTISDAPTFYNISALFISFDNVSIRSSTTGKWYSIPLQTSSFDLIRLKNVSSILSGVRLDNGTYDELVFHVSAVNAIVNGTARGVFLPTNTLRVFGDFNISNNGTTNWINIDFDLAHSLHITPDGSVILLPVLNIGNRHGSIMRLNQSSIIVPSYSGIPGAFYEFGMDVNGIMTRNYTTPQNWSMRLSNGRPEVSGPRVAPTITRRGHNFVIGVDVDRNIWPNNGTNTNSVVNGSWPMNGIIWPHNGNSIDSNAVVNGIWPMNRNNRIWQH
jgi:DNA-binding transcriptional ArsR family regulator